MSKDRRSYWPVCFRCPSTAGKRWDRRSSTKDREVNEVRIWKSRPRAAQPRVRGDAPRRGAMRCQLRTDAATCPGAPRRNHCERGRPAPYDAAEPAAVPGAELGLPPPPKATADTALFPGSPSWTSVIVPAARWVSPLWLSAEPLVGSTPTGLPKEAQGSPRRTLGPHGPMIDQPQRGCIGSSRPGDYGTPLGFVWHGRATPGWRLRRDPGLTS